MVFVEPSKSRNVQGLWLDEKRNQFFLLQRHRAAETRLGSSLQLMRNVLGPASGADGYRIILATQPYYQVASAFDHQDILQDWVWIEEHLMPLAEKMEARDFRILTVKYFHDLAHGKHFHLPRIGSVQADLNRLDKQEASFEEERKNLPDEEEIAVLGPDDPDEDAIDEVDLDADDAPPSAVAARRAASGDEWIANIIGGSGSSAAESGEVASVEEGSFTSGESTSGQRAPVPVLEPLGDDHHHRHHHHHPSALEWPGLSSMPEQYTNPEAAFGWLRTMARGTEDDGWRYITEEVGVTFSRKEVDGPNGKREIYKGTVVVDAPAKNVLDMLVKADKWPKWDRTLSKVQVLDRIDDRNHILHLHVKKFFPSFATFAQAVNPTKKSIAETERDMVVCKSWGTHERDSYVVYLRSVDYDKQQPEPGVTRMETDGYGFLVEPMSSVFPASANVRSPLNQSSGFASMSIVTFVSNIDWKGWLTPVMGEHVHFTKIMLLDAIRNSFAPDLAFVGQKSTTASTTEEEEQQQQQQQQQQEEEHGQYSFQSAMKGFTTFVEEKKKRVLEEREKRNSSKEREGSGAEAAADEGGESEPGMLGRFKAMIDGAKTERSKGEGEGEKESESEDGKSEKGLWNQWKQALTLKTAHGDDQQPPQPVEKEMVELAAPEGKGWLDKFKGTLGTKDESAAPPAAAASVAGEQKGWLERMKEKTAATTATSTNPAPEAAPATSSSGMGGSGWLSRMKESVAPSVKRSDEASTGEQKGWLERMKEAVKTNKETTTAGTGSEQQTLTIKFSIMESDDGLGGKGKEEEKEDAAEETRKQQNDSITLVNL